jgi:hypothetical protein
MIRSHSDDYRPPRDSRPMLAGVVVLLGACVLIAGLVWLAVRWVSWLLK